MEMVIKSSISVSPRRWRRLRGRAGNGEAVGMPLS